MPNDAKLGLVVGVGLVLAIGAVFFHKEAPPPAVPPPAAQRPARPAAVGDAALDLKEVPADAPATAKR